jgi:hypothetical protein
MAKVNKFDFGSIVIDDFAAGKELGLLTITTFALLSVFKGG